MIVTDLKYFLEEPIVKKLNIMINRCEQQHPKKDAVLIIEGGEGEGKSNTSIANAYYVKSQTNREIHLFFRLKALIEFAKSTERMIIIWDEPALDALSSDWYKRINKDLITLLMVVRKKRHFFLFNFTKFHKFSEYIVVDRGLGLIHMYSRNEVEAGRFVYIKKRALEPLYLAYKVSKKRLYKKFASFRGSYPDIIEKLFDRMGIYVEGKANATYNDYEMEKDKAILSVGTEEGGSKSKEEIHKLKYSLGILDYPISDEDNLAKQLGIDSKTLKTWKKRYKNDENS